jgi:D-3-phosphoglycerate dehydrogenase
MKILILDDIAPVCGDYLQHHGFEVEQAGNIKDVRDRLAQFAVILVRSASKVKAEEIALAPNLQVIGRGGVGLDNIDLAAANQRRIAVISTPDANTISTAELTFALMLSLARKVPMAQRSLEQGLWKRNDFRGVELSGKTLGVIGFGRIGREVAARARAFSMRILAHDPLIPAETISSQNAEAVTLATALARSDFITLHAPLNDSTKQLINTESLKMVKRGACLINCARGGLTDELAVRQALESGQLSGVALDVYAEEPPPKDHPLIGHPRVVCVPHLGALTDEAQTRAAEELAANVVAYLRDKSLRGVVNAEVVAQNSQPNG